MPRRNKRWDTHQSFSFGTTEWRHECTVIIPTRTGHICLRCGRPTAVAL